MDIIHDYTGRVPAGYQRYQLDDAVLSIIPPDGTSRVVIQAENLDIRYRDDGALPTATVGMKVANGTEKDNLSRAQILKIISTTVANAVAANCILDSTGVNADVVLTADETGPNFNGYVFETDADANMGANSTVVLLSGAVNSDLTFTATGENPADNGETFETVNDATLGANATATLLSAAVNSDLTFTAVSKSAADNGETIETVNDATLGANATVNLASAAVNSDLTFTAVGKSAVDNGETIETVNDATLGVNSSVVLDSAAVNSDLTFTAVGKSAADNGETFETVNDATLGVNATAALSSVAVNSDLTFTAVTKSVADNGYTFETINDVTVGANADAVLDSTGVNSDLMFTAPALGVIYNGYTFEIVNSVNIDVDYDANSQTFTIEIDTGVSNAAQVKTVWDATLAFNPAWPQFALAVDGDGSGVVDGALSDLSANGVDVQIEEVTFAANTFTIHIEGTVTTANDVAIAWLAGPANCANWDIAEEGDGTGDVDVDSDISAGGITPVATSIGYAANTFTIHILVEGTTTAADVVALWAGGPAECANWAVADEGAGAGVVDIESEVSAGGVTPVATSIDYASNTFTIHILVEGTTSANDVVTLWGTGPAECANWDILEEGNGLGVVDVTSDVSANGVTPVATSIGYAANIFTIHILDSLTTVANEVVALWAGGPAECANWDISDEGNGAGVVDVTSEVSAGGVTPVATSIDYAVNTFTIHILVEGTTVANEVVTLWAGGPAECANWNISDEGAGGGVVDVVSEVSAGGVTEILPYVEYAVNTFTIHILDTGANTAAQVETLINNAMTANPGWPQFGAAKEGAGAGTVDDGLSEITSNGSIPVGAVVHLNFYRDQEF